jgi:hypothetical protein
MRIFSKSVPGSARTGRATSSGPFAAVPVPDPQAAAAALIDELVVPMRLCRCGSSEQPRLPLHELPPPVVDAVERLVGQGAVSAIVRRAPGSDQVRVRIQETAYCGLWRVRHYETGHQLHTDVLEAAPIPQVIRAALLRDTDESLEIPAAAADRPLARALLAEIAAALAEREPDAAPHAIDLGRLALSAADVAAVESALGCGPVSIECAGHTRCVADSTRVQNVWSVVHYDGAGGVALHAIEVAAIPAMVAADCADMAAAVDRLAEAVRGLRQAA